MVNTSTFAADSLHARVGGQRRSEDDGGPVALVNVTIERHRLSNFAVALHTTDRDRNVIDHAEAFTVVGKRMVEAAANADGDSVAEGVLGGEYGAASGQEECAYDVRASRESPSPTLRER